MSFIARSAMTLLVMLLTTATSWADTIKYIDENGDEQYCENYTVLNNGTNINDPLASGWYVVEGNVNYNGTLYFSGDVNLILADGANLTAICSGDDSGIEVAGNLTIYAQSLGSNQGTINATSSSGSGIYAQNGNITINGGNINAKGGEHSILAYQYGINTTITINHGNVNANGGYDGSIYAKYINIYGGTINTSNTNYGINAEADINIYGGTVIANGSTYGLDAYENINIYGGKVTACGNTSGMNTYGDITLGWTNDSDYIFASSYEVGYGNNVIIASGKTFFDGKGHSYSDGYELSSDEIDGISGETLRTFNYRNYIDTDGSIKYCTDFTEINSNTQTTSFGEYGEKKWYVVTENVSFTESVTFSGNVHLILVDGAEMNITFENDDNGIWAAGSLTIYAQSTGSDQGELTINAGGVGINASNITIVGGTINVNGKSNGIYANGDIIIYGGNITATTTTTNSNNGGIFSYEGDITINGGTIIAEATGDNSYGIYAENITINGGIITAKATGNEANGIYASSGGTVTLAGGIVKSNSYDGTVTIGSGFTYTDGTNLYVNNDLTSAVLENLTNVELYPAIPYIDSDGEELTCTNYTLLTGSEESISGGWYVVKGNVSYNSKLSFTGDTNLILADGAHFTINGDWCGINVQDNDKESNLTIYAQSTGESKGKVEIEAGTGIYVWNGNLTINGGDIIANGYANGIEIGYGGIIINGGTITVSGTEGYGIITDTWDETSCDIIINGGTIIATGEDDGINGGGDIIINGGNISSNGYYGGTNANDGNGTITLNGGTITSNYYNGIVKVADDLAYYDGADFYSGTLYDGTSSSEVIFTNLEDLNTAIGDKTLHPVQIILSETDGITASIATEIAGKPAMFSRTFKAGVASTICLPFPMTSIEGGKVYEFVGVDYDETDGWVATMIDASPEEGNLLSATVANKPYLFKADIPSDKSEGDAVDINLFGTVDSSVSASAGTTTNTDGDWTFYGTYARLEYGTSPMNGNVYGFAANTNESGTGDDYVAGEFVRAVSGASVKPFRAFLTYTGSEESLNANARSKVRGAANGLPESITVRLLGKDGEINGIGTITLSTGEFSTDGWYSLDGRKFDGKPTKKGLYIHDGKKVAIK